MLKLLRFVCINLTFRCKFGRFPWKIRWNIFNMKVFDAWVTVFHGTLICRSQPSPVLKSVTSRDLLSFSCLHLHSLPHDRYSPYTRLFDEMEDCSIHIRTSSFILPWESASGCLARGCKSMVIPLNDDHLLRLLQFYGSQLYSRILLGM